jgi:prepilin-type N-terminal cleavage/methylation domain-containing protein
MRGRIELLRGDTGFTLVEVLIALVIFTIGLLGTAALTVTVIQTNAISKRQSQAIVHAQDRLEEVRELGYSNAAAAQGTEYIDPATQTWAAGNAYVSYKRQTVVNADTPAAGMTTVTVTVSWDSDARSVSMTNIFAAQ